MKHNDNNEAVCIIGTLTPEKEFNKIQALSNQKAATSPIIMQSNIFRSLLCICPNSSCYAFPPIAAYPKSKIVIIKKRRLDFENSSFVNQIFVVNIPGIKQISVFFSILNSLGKWARQNKNSKRYILTYADFTAYCLPALIIGKIYAIPVVLFLTELPGFAHYKKGKYSVKELLIRESERIKQRLYKLYDGYVFVSRHLKDIVPTNSSPWTIVEGFAEETLFDNCILENKTQKKTIMYAGSLGDAYNIKMMCDAFSKTKGDYQFWICGEGRNKEYVEKISKRDPRIIYFGKLPREQVIRLERKSHLLIHAKNTQDSLSKYSFSSKIIEYMTTGTPVLTTRVEGIPDEYYLYSYVTEECDQLSITKAIENTLNLPENELQLKGAQAKDFILSKKNKRVQGMKIMDVFRNAYELKNSK